jgi:hypothetical protein
MWLAGRAMQGKKQHGVLEAVIVCARVLPWACGIQGLGCAQ